MNPVIRRAGLAGVLALMTGSAWADPCESILLSYEFYVTGGYPEEYAGEMVSDHPECFAGSSATSRMQIEATSFAQAGAISNALAMRQPGSGPVKIAVAEGLYGMAAGNGASRWNVWGNVNQNDTRQSYTSRIGNKVRNRADVLTSVLGADYAITPDVVLGLSASIDDGAGEGRVNQTVFTPPVVSTNSIDTRGYQIAPYVGWQISSALSLDASAGFGRGKMETSGNTESRASRRFFAANLNYNRWFDNLQFSGRLGYLHGVERYGDIKNTRLGNKFANTDARNTLDQLRLNAQVGYWLNGVMPYTGLTYVNDLRRKSSQFGNPGNPVGRSGWLWSLGVNVFSIKDNVSAGLVYNHEVGRSHQLQRGVIANLNLRF